MKHPYKVDIPVLLIFFARPEIFAKVFEQVKQARPSRIFLYQDGPRDGHAADVEKIRRCREIAENIDWECEVHKFYQPKNVGCDPSGFIAQTWAFSIVDRCLVLEDDCVPAQSFFRFCAELLEKFKDDERIGEICGLNHLEVSEDNPHDYLFTTAGSMCGWASWKRVVGAWEEHYDFLDDKYALRLLKQLPAQFGKNDAFVQHALSHRQEGKAHHETILGANNRLNSRLNIVPTRNMICNIGFGEDQAHSQSWELMPKAIRNIFYMKTYEIKFPLNHPRYMVCDMEHVNKVSRILNPQDFVINLWRRVECRFIRIVYIFRKFFGRN